MREAVLELVDRIDRILDRKPGLERWKRRFGTYFDSAHDDG